MGTPRDCDARGHGRPDGADCGSAADAAPRQARPEQTTEAAALRAAGEPIMAIVSIKSQKVTIYDADGWVLRAPVFERN